LRGSGRARRPGGDIRRFAGAVVSSLLGALASVGVTVAWIPLRRGHSSVEVALALVLVMTAAGSSRRRPAVAGAAAGAAVGFTYFDTLPFDHLAIARPPDLVTAVMLTIVGVLTAELALRVARTRQSEGSARAYLDRVRDAAALLAHGEELVVLIGAVAEELAAVLHVDDCWFSTEPPPPDAPLVDRSGELQPEGTGASQVVLPVWALGRIVGHFVLSAASAGRLPADRLRVAMTLADQVGAALAAQTPLPPLPPDGATPELRPRLRVVGADESAAGAVGPSSGRARRGWRLPAAG